MGIKAAVVGCGLWVIVEVAMDMGYDWGCSCRHTAIVVNCAGVVAKIGMARLCRQDVCAAS